MSMETVCHKCRTPKVSGGICLVCHEERKAKILSDAKAARLANKKPRKGTLTPAQRSKNIAWRARRDAKKRAIARKARPGGGVPRLRYRRIKENGGTLSPGLAAHLMSVQQGLCACCGKPLGDTHHLDHIVPLAKGGRNSDENMQLLLPACNHTKHAKDPIAFMKTQRPEYVLVWARLLRDRRKGNT